MKGEGQFGRQGNVLVAVLFFVASRQPSAFIEKTGDMSDHGTRHKYTTYLHLTGSEAFWTSEVDDDNIYIYIYI